MKGETVAVLGASPNARRYAWRAIQMLREYGHKPLPVNPAFSEVSGERCYASISDVPEKIDTVTLYIRPSRTDKLIGEIVAAKPRRIIMNPGAENPRLAHRAQEQGIEVVEGCTLVMLRAGLF